MSIRRRIIDYSRGNNLRHFWRLYKMQKKTGEGFLHDILTFMMSRCAHRHGGYIGPDTVIKGSLTRPHGLHFKICQDWGKLPDISECNDWRSE